MIRHSLDIGGALVVVTPVIQPSVRLPPTSSSEALYGHSPSTLLAQRSRSLGGRVAAPAPAWLCPTAASSAVDQFLSVRPSLSPLLFTRRQEVSRRIDYRRGQ